MNTKTVLFLAIWPLILSCGNNNNAVEPQGKNAASPRRAKTASASASASMSTSTTVIENSDSAHVEIGGPLKEPPAISDIAQSIPATEKIDLKHIRFDICSYQLCIKAGKKRVRMKMTATKVNNVKKVPNGFVVKYTNEGACAEADKKLEITHNQVAARFQNASAFGLHSKKEFHLAAAGFRAAVALDPNLYVARTNLACALAQLNKIDEAIEVLLEKDKTLALRSYLKIMTDDDLIPLRSHPRVVQEHSVRRGDAKLQLHKGEMADFGIAYSAHKKLVAVISTHQSWATSGHYDALDIFDANSGQRVIRKNLIYMGDVDPHDDSAGVVLPGRRKIITKRLKDVSGLLTTLGFRVVQKSEMHQGIDSGDAPGNLFRLKKEKLAIFSHPSHLRLKRNGKPFKKIQTERTLGYLQQVNYLPALKLLVVETHIDEPEGCDAEQEIAASIVVPIDLSI